MIEEREEDVLSVEETEVEVTETETVSSTVNEEFVNVEKADVVEDAAGEELEESREDHTEEDFEDFLDLETDGLPKFNEEGGATQEEEIKTKADVLIDAFADGVTAISLDEEAMDKEVAAIMEEIETLNEDLISDGEKGSLIETEVTEAEVQGIGTPEDTFVEKNLISYLEKGAGMVVVPEIPNLSREMDLSFTPEKEGSVLDVDSVEYVKTEEAATESEEIEVEEETEDEELMEEETEDECEEEVETQEESVEEEATVETPETPVVSEETPAEAETVEINTMILFTDGEIETADSDDEAVQDLQAAIEEYLADNGDFEGDLIPESDIIVDTVEELETVYNAPVVTVEEDLASALDSAEELSRDDYTLEETATPVVEESVEEVEEACTEDECEEEVATESYSALGDFLTSVNNY